MDYKKTAMTVTAVATVAFMVWTGVKFKSNVDEFSAFKEKYPMPYDMELTDSINLAKLDSLYMAHAHDTVSFAYYKLTHQENGFIVALAVNAENRDRIVRFGVPAQVRFGGIVDIDSNPLTTCRTISGCTEGNLPYYNGEYKWTVTDCEKVTSLYPNCTKTTYFRLPDEIEDNHAKEVEAQEGEARQEEQEEQP